MAESVPVEENEDKKTKGKPRKADHIKMFVVNDLKSEIIDNKVVNNVEASTIIDSDYTIFYTNLKKLVAEYRSQVILKEMIDKSLPCVISQ